MGYTKQEKMVLVAFDSILGFEYGGLVNAVFDGNMTSDDFAKEVTVEDMEQTLKAEMEEAYETGYLQADNGQILIEANHLKFLGNNRLDKLMTIASKKMIKDSDIQSILQGEHE